MSGNLVLGNGRPTKLPSTKEYRYVVYVITEKKREVVRI